VRLQEGSGWDTLNEEHSTAHSSSQKRKRVKPCSSDSARALSFGSRLPVPEYEGMPASRQISAEVQGATGVKVRRGL